MSVSDDAAQRSANGRLTRKRVYQSALVGLLVLVAACLLSKRFGKRQTVEVPEGISLSDSLQDAGSKAPEGWYAIKGKGQSSPAARVAAKDRVKYLYYR